MLLVVESIICYCYRPVHGLIFLFKWKDDDDMEGSVVRDSRLDSIFFAKQVDIVLCPFITSLYVDGSMI